MESWGKIFIGIVLTILSIGYLYKPNWIFAIYALARGFLFDDSHVLLYRKRIGFFIFIIAGLFFFSGFNNLASIYPERSDSSYTKLESAYRDFRGNNYKKAIVQCQEILERQPDNTHAWILQGSAWAALGEKEKAESSWAHVSVSPSE